MEIKIHNDTYQVVFADSDEPKLNPKKNHINLGLTEYCDGLITIRKGLSESLTRATVIHELVHAFIFSFGYEIEGEEAMCNFFGANADEIIRLTNEIMKGVKEDADRNRDCKTD